MARCLSLANSIYNGEKGVGKAKKSPYETILIICEDSKSSYYYFNELIKSLRLNTANVVIVPSRGSAPISVVEHSIEIVKNSPYIDRVACVFDRDNHESYERAIKIINSHRPKRNDKNKPTYKAITSTPCFEIWLLLHFLYTTRAYHSAGNKSAADNLISDLEKKFPSYTKGTAYWFKKLNDKLNIAMKHAKQLEQHNNQTNSVNPATNIHELVEYLINIKKN